MVGVILPWLGGGGFNFTDFLQYLENYGFFAYILPFLLVFALVYAILSTMDLFKKNKGSAVIISIAIGFLSLMGGYVPTFFATIFPRFGVALSILLVGLILMGSFLLNDEKGKDVYKWVFFALGGIIFLFVMFSSMAGWEFWGAGNWGYWWDNYAGLILFVFILAGVIIAVTVANKDKSGKP
jgi:hypothetical protein